MLKVAADTIALDMFISMLNPEYRGPNFRYASFDIEAFVSNMVGRSLSWEISQADKEKAGIYARSSWDRWVKTAGKGLPL